MFRTISPLYIPFTWLTLGLDYVLWGMDPLGYHITSLAWHALNAVLCFLVLESLLRRVRPDDRVRDRAWIAAAGALFFAVHPLRVESVSWVTERRDVTSGAFFFLTLLAYLRMTDRPAGSAPRRAWLALTTAAFAACILCKPTAMTLPLALLVLDYYPLRRNATESRASLLVEKIPLAGVMVVAAVLTVAGLSEARTLAATEHYPFSQRLLQPGLRVPFYVVKTLLPFRLSPLYPYVAEVSAIQIFGWAGLLIGTGLAFRLRSKFPAILAACLGFLALVAPVSGLAHAGSHFAADRYSYLACLPFAALFAAGLIGRPKSFGIAAAMVLAALAGLTAQQCLIWRDSQTLWTRAIEIGPPNFLPHLNRGTARLDAGDVRGAIEDYDRSIELDPAHDKSWNSRGFARERLGNGAGARSDYDEALRLNPGYILALTNRGSLRKKMGDGAGALEDATDALRRDPSAANAYILRASILRAGGDLPAAEADLDRAIALLPISVEAFNNRGMIRMQTGRLADALADYDRALALKPGNPPVLVGRGQARLLLKDASGAAADFDQALRLSAPDWPLRRDVQALLQRARSESR
jgi:tetratricopeptide (TPR) repeat protein